MEQFDILDDLTLTPDDKDVSTVHGIGPVVLVGVGGTGAEVLSRVKAQIHWLGMQRLFEFVVVDSDDRAMGGASNGMPFSGEEYCHLDFRMMEDVLEHPHLYREIAERLDLSDPAVLSSIRVKVQSFGEDEGCGQIRPIGSLRFAANYAAFSNSLTRAVADVQHVWNRLLDRIKNVPRGRLARSNLPVIVVGSVCGGTGSAVLVDTVVAIRSLIQDVEVRGYLTMPSVYERVIDAEQLERVRANAYASIKEIEFFQRGLGRNKGVRFDYHGGSFESPNTLFNLCYLIERRDAAGSDLGKPDQVYDAMALGITAEIALTVGARLRMENANQAAVNLAKNDAEMNVPRFYSTMGATAVSIPRRRLLRLGAFRAARILLEETVLGPEGSSEEIDRRVDQFLKSAHVDDRSVPHQHMLADDIRSRARVNVTAFADRLFVMKKKGGRAVRECRPDKRFVPDYDKFEAWWQNQGRDGARDAIEKAATKVEKPLGKKLAELVRVEVGSFGLIGCDQVLDRLAVVLQSLQRSIGVEADDCRNRAQEAFGQAKKASEAMRGFFGQFGTDTAAQETVATHLEAALMNDVMAMILAKTDEIVAKVSRAARDWDLKVEQAAEARMPDLDKALRGEERTLAQAAELFGDSRMEISLLGPAEITDICARSMPGGELLAATAHNLGGNAELQAYLHPDFGQELLRKCGEHYKEVLKELDACDIVRRGVATGGGDRIRKLIEEGIRACQPLWSARGPRVTFPESIVVGIAATQGSAAWRAVEDIVKKLTPDLHRPGYTHKDVAIEPTSDKGRIHISRRSHGGRPHYLATWPQCKQMYDRLADASGALSLHGFPRSLVARFPALEPDPNKTADLAFALGMAFGWIAKRGTSYYVNLWRHVRKDGREHFEVPLITQWDCIVAEGGKRRSGGTILSPLLQARTLSMGNETRAKPEYRLSKSRAQAQKQLRTEDFRDVALLVTRVFDEYVIEGTPPDEVADALAAYVEKELEGGRGGRTDRAAMNREAALLRAHIDRLREI